MSNQLSTHVTNNHDIDKLSNEFNQSSLHEESSKNQITSHEHNNNKLSDKINITDTNIFNNSSNNNNNNNNNNNRTNNVLSHSFNDHLKPMVAGSSFPYSPYCSITTNTVRPHSYSHCDASSFHLRKGDHNDHHVIYTIIICSVTILIVIIIMIIIIIMVISRFNIHQLSLHECYTINIGPNYNKYKLKAPR